MIRFKHVSTVVTLTAVMLAGQLLSPQPIRAQESDETCNSLDLAAAGDVTFETPAELAEGLAAREGGIAVFEDYITANNCLYVNFDPSDGAAFLVVNAKGAAQGAHEPTATEQSLASILAELQRLKQEGGIARINAQFIMGANEQLATAPNGNGGSTENTFVRIWAELEINSEGHLAITPPRDPNRLVTVFHQGGQGSYEMAANALEGWFTMLANAGIDPAAIEDMQGRTIRLAAGGSDGRSGSEVSFSFNADRTQWNLTRQRYGDTPEQTPEDTVLETWRDTPRPREREQAREETAALGNRTDAAGAPWTDYLIGRNVLSIPAGITRS